MPSARPSDFGRKRMEDNSMTEKRERRNPIERRVPQGQVWAWSKLDCLNRRLLALSLVDAPPPRGNIGLCASDGPGAGISILPVPGSETVPTLCRSDEGPNAGPKPRHCAHVANQGLPKPDAAGIGHGNGAPVVVRPANGRISCEGGQMDGFGLNGGTPDADSREDARSAWRGLKEAP